LLAAVPALFVLAATGVGGASLLTWLSTWGSPAAFVVGAGLCLWRAQTLPADRSPWRWFFLACTCWAAANLYYALGVAPDPLPLPSPADIGYVTFPFAVSAGLLQLARTRLSRIPSDVWLDSVIATLGTAAIASAVVFKLGDVGSHNLAEIITSLVYPLGDIAVLGVLVGVASLLGWRVDRRLWLIAIGVLAITAADLVVFSRVLNGSLAGGAWSNLGWTTGIALFAASAWASPSPRAAIPVPPPRVQLVLPVAFAACALLVLSLGSVLHFSPPATIFATTALGVSCFRLFRSFREVRVLADSRRLAFTDELTNLPNRRRLLRDLDRACSRGSSHLLALFDLDGFKHFNDTFGHPDGDLLLSRLAARLAATVAPSGVAYRLGGDEFCVISPATSASRAEIGAAVAALTEAGPGWSITASFGVVEIPIEAASVPDAMRLADRRMYAQKDRRPAAARQQARDVLLTALDEQQPLLRLHTEDVTVLAAGVARRLGMSPEDVDDVIRAAELHDVGKLAISREILDKPGALSESEWELMRQHTIIGERMLRAAPALSLIAPMVRSSHERWAGGGYPDGLVGEAIPLGARIVAVCDSFDAMVADRAYRAGMPREEAIAELRRCAGTQFDPYVVDAFLAVLEGAPEEYTRQPSPVELGLSRAYP
jgi:diguanylate cyclase (GGDEF)-like protein